MLSKKILTILVVSIASNLCTAQAGTKITTTSKDSEDDSSILIQKKKNAKIDPDYEIISGEEEISGDPVSGRDAALLKWKEACKEWKKELKENKENPLIYSSCGSAKEHRESGGSGISTYSSTAKYKIKVKIRDTK